MNKSTYHIPAMDCPSEEQMIRMKLADMPNIKELRFDIPGRQLEVVHEKQAEPISEQTPAPRYNKKPCGLSC